MSSGCRWPAVEHRVELRVEPGLDLGVLGEQVERPRQVGVQVLGAEEGLDRAAQVGVGPAQLVVHADPVEQEVVAFEAVATRRRRCVDGGIERAAELVAAPGLGRRKPPAQRAERVHEPSQPRVPGRERVVDDGPSLVEGLTGERAPADPVGHASQVVVGLDRAPVAPLLRPAHRLLDAPLQDRGIGQVRDPHAVAVHVVDRARLGRQAAFIPVLDEVHAPARQRRPLLALEPRLDDVRMVGEIALQHAQLERHERAFIPADPFQHGQGTAKKLPELGPGVRRGGLWHPFLAPSASYERATGLKRAPCFGSVAQVALGWGSGPSGR